MSQPPVCSAAAAAKQTTTATTETMPRRTHMLSRRNDAGGKSAQPHFWEQICACLTDIVRVLFRCSPASRRHGDQVQGLRVAWPPCHPCPQPWRGIFRCRVRAHRGRRRVCASLLVGVCVCGVHSQGGALVRGTIACLCASYASTMGVCWACADRVLTVCCTLLACVRTQLHDGRLRLCA